MFISVPDGVLCYTKLQPHDVYFKIGNKMAMSSTLLVGNIFWNFEWRFMQYKSFIY